LKIADQKLIKAVETFRAKNTINKHEQDCHLMEYEWEYNQD